MLWTLFVQPVSDARSQNLSPARCWRERIHENISSQRCGFFFFFLFFFRSGCRKRSNARRCACRKTFPPLNGCASIQCSNWLPENKYLTSEYSDPGNWGHYKIATEAYDETFSAFCLCTVVYPGILWLLNNCAWASFTGKHCFYFLHIHYSNRTSILFLKLLFVYVASQ